MLNAVYAQEFPKNWEGRWKGELNIYDSKSVKPVMNLRMELYIEYVNDSVWNWKIIYITPDKQDIRAYELYKTAKPGKWIMDEKNGIQLNQTFICNRLISSFSIEKTLLVASYWLENNVMNFEIVVTNLTPESTTGSGNEASPSIGNHPVNSYHRAVMYKMD